MIHRCSAKTHRHKVLMLASVASMIDQFNIPNIQLLIKMGYEVHVACNYKEGNTCDAAQIRRMHRLLQKMHVFQHQWDCPRKIYAAGRCLTAYKQLLDLTRRHAFSWIHCHSPVGGVLARMAAHKRGIRIIYTAHGFHFFKGAPLKNWLLYYPVEKLFAHWTDALITVNMEDYQFARKHFKAGRVFYISGVGIDVGKFQPHCRQAVFCSQYHIPEDAVILLSVGELSRRKNHQIVIRALRRLARQDVYYLICGQGDLKEELLAQAKKQGVADRVIFLGFQKDVISIYQNADIFVFPSIQEGMPVALMEAMASGMPCIVSDIRGSRELIDGPDDVMVHHKMNNSIGQLCRLLQLFIDHKQLRDMLGEYNREKIQAYDLCFIQRKMEMIYKYIETLH